MVYLLLNVIHLYYSTVIMTSVLSKGDVVSTDDRSAAAVRLHSPKPSAGRAIITAAFYWTLVFAGCWHVLTHPASDVWDECGEDRAGGGAVDCGLPSPACRAGVGGWSRGLPAMGSRQCRGSILGSVLVFSSLALLVNCHGTCKHKVPSRHEVSRCQHFPLIYYKNIIRS